jgi:hypothetical protein
MTAPYLPDLAHLANTRIAKNAGTEHRCGWPSRLATCLAVRSIRGVRRAGADRTQNLRGQRYGDCCRGPTWCRAEKRAPRHPRFPWSAGHVGAVIVSWQPWQTSPTANQLGNSSGSAASSTWFDVESAVGELSLRVIAHAACACLRWRRIRSAVWRRSSPRRRSPRRSSH